MNYRNHLPYFLFALGLASLASCSQSSTEQPTSQAPPKPNIVYILADDLGYGDLSFLGQSKFTTPNIDQLAERGLIFTEHYSGSTVCAPSRSSLLSGLHGGHTPIRGNREIEPEGQYPLADSVYTLMELLQDQGYTTGVFGKWGLGYPGSEGDPLNQGVDRFYGYNCQRLAHHYYPRHLWDNDQKQFLPENEGKNKGVFAPDLIHQEALAFMEKHQSEPFFLFYASPLPHAELVAPEEIMEKYRGKFDPEEPYEGYDEGPDYRKGPYESQEHPHAAFAAMVHTLDQEVGEIMAALDSLGLAENTLVIFTSDNGAHKEGGADPDYFDSNGPFRGYKRDLYEGGIHVPMVAVWADKITPGTTDHVSAFWDVVPTVRDLLGLNPAAGMTDGISFLPTLLGNPSQQKQHEYLYWEFDKMGGRMAVRLGDWKGVRYKVARDPDAAIELYDLATDPGETNNVADQHPKVVERIKALMAEAHWESPVYSFN